MVKSGELALTSVAALYPKITAANEKALLDAVSHQPKRDVERLAARITPSGEWTEGEAEVELKLVLKESDMQKIERAREVLSHVGRIPVTAEILMQAVEELLERRDPIVGTGPRWKWDDRFAVAGSLSPVRPGANR